MDTITAIVRNVSKDRSQELSTKEIEMIKLGLRMVHHELETHMYPDREEMARSEKLWQLFTNGP